MSGDKSDKDLFFELPNEILKKDSITALWASTVETTKAATQFYETYY